MAPAQTSRLARLGVPVGKRWDAVLATHPIKVTIALPDDERETRGGKGGRDRMVRWKHAADSLQFPQKIIDAIERERAKNYGDDRTLVVSVENRYSADDSETEER